MICWVLATEMLQGVWKQHLRPRAVVGYGVKIFLPSPPNYVTRTPGKTCLQVFVAAAVVASLTPYYLEKYGQDFVAAYDFRAKNNSKETDNRKNQPRESSQDFSPLKWRENATVPWFTWKFSQHWFLVWNVWTSDSHSWIQEMLRKETLKESSNKQVTVRVVSCTKLL